MPVISSLLRRAQANAAGMYVDNPWDTPANATPSPLEQNWYAWTQGFIALANGNVRDAHAWLRAAEERLAEQDDDLCRAEVNAAWMQLADSVDEPRDAAAYAADSWRRWFALAASPDPSEAMPSLRALMCVLAPDQSIPDARLFVEWMADRLAPQLQNVFKTIVRLYGTLGLAQEALIVADQMRSWFDTNLSQVPEELRVVSYADLQESVGNLHDQDGDLQASFDAFSTGVSLLDVAVDHPDVHHLRARLSFNAANELSKMGRYDEATPYFARSLETFEQLHSTEPALRAKHALLVNRFKTGNEDPTLLRTEVEGLAIAYESLGDDETGVAVRQNLDSAYRLWLTLAAPDANGDEQLTHRFLGQLYALREGLGTFARDWANGPAAATDKVILSEAAVLAARLARCDRTVLLILESGVDAVVLTTIRSGAAPLSARVHAALGEEPFADALVAMLEQYREATNDVIQRTLPVKSVPSTEFMEACQGVWKTLPGHIRDDLAQADTIFVMPSNSGVMDEVPVELLHDGTEFLGTRACVVRTSSLKHLVATLGDNRVNVDRFGSSVVVRAGDVGELGLLPNADSEVDQVTKVLVPIGELVAQLTDPTFAELSDALGEGADVLHFVGHGMADENGEMLILGAGSDSRARAIDLRGLGPAPAPVCVLSSCQLGRSRHLRSGEQQGVVVALLEAGAPAVIAATYTVPDIVGRQFALAFYRKARTDTVGNALRDARRTLAKSGVHPVAWGSFIMFGDPSAPLLRQPTDVAALDWPACLVRLAATGAQVYGDAARARLQRDARLNPADRASIGKTIAAFERGDASEFTSEVIRRPSPLLRLDAESYLSHSVLELVGALRFRLIGDGSDEERRSVLALLRQFRPMLEDSYLRVAIARESVRDMAFALTTDEGRSLVRGGLRTLAWLSADDDLLGETKQALAEAREAAEQAIVFNVQDMLGVDTDTYLAADTGDRQAQKRLVRELFTRRASVAALASDEPWTTWMLRMIASGSEQSICDLFGVIDESRKAQRLPREEASALDELLEQFIGPDEVRGETAALVTATFAEAPFERDVIALFLAHDRLASGAPDVTLDEIEQAIRLSDDIGSEAALCFFVGVWSQYAAQEGQLDPAISAAHAALGLATKLAANDEELADRVGRTAMLLQQLYTFARQPTLAAAVQLEYSAAIAAHQRRASGEPAEDETEETTEDVRPEPGTSQNSGRFDQQGSASGDSSSRSSGPPPA